ncbi:MAG: hypothetical protein LBT27_08355, partial [Prevotellaceae bacterium]|nr:hypothetical protein [Prevotellaceae bacterium]
KIMKKILLLSILLFVANFLFGQVRLPKPISNGMVLQRDAPIKIWGWASPKETVKIKFLDNVYQTKADKKGEWNITLPAQSAGGAYTMQINEREISDILIGDVWICSGQSNMELQMSRVMDMFKDEISEINNPYIRHYKTPLSYNFQQADNDLSGGEWKAATPENIMNISATAYFFAKYLYEKYQVPIGLLNSSVGGSPVEAWISTETLKNYPEYLKETEKCADINYVENTKKQDGENTFKWFLDLNKKDAGLSKWHKTDVDISDWSDISLPGYWMDKNVDLKAGIIWFRKEIDVPASMTGKDAILRLGCIVDSDSAFVNGTFVGNITYQYPPRIYPVKKGILKTGKNVIAIRVTSNGWRGGFVEEKQYKLIAGNESIDLTGDWKYKTGAEASYQMSPTTTFHYKPAGLYNSMIAPLLNFAVKGVIWYQGESNTGRAKEYKNLFADLIFDWRNKWNKPQLPFIFVQLANFMKSQNTPQESGWATLRDVQRRTLNIPYTGMAVAIDIGEWNDIHPLNKKELGRRLALEAQRLAYNDEITVSAGPLYKSMEIKDNSIILTFTSVGSGIYTNLDLKGFAIAAEDGKYVWANAVVVAKDKVKVWSYAVKNPVSVRYAWADNPDDANLKNKEGLPASPFETEN